jgi:hypothetical protein
MRKHCGNCAVYDRKNMKHSELCGKCVKEHFPNGKESDPSMWKPLPQTNADRIRAMTDEELAKFIIVNTPYRPIGDIGCSYHGASGEGYFEPHEAMKDWIKWLKQPAEGGKNDGN